MLNTIFMTDPSKNLERSSDRGQTLWVEWNGGEGLLYKSPSSKSPIYHRVKLGLNWNYQAIDSMWKELDLHLNDAVNRKDLSDEEIWQSIKDTLRNRGRELFEFLIPRQIAKRIKRWEKSEHARRLETDLLLRISTNESWIPWELLHDGEDFWGNKFTIGRYPRWIEDEEFAPNKNRLESGETVKIKKIINVIGGEILTVKDKELTKEVKQAIVALFENLSLSIQAVPLIERSFSALVSATKPDGVDALHFTCHSRLETEFLLQIYQDSSLTQNLSLNGVGSLELNPGSLVFANTCSSAIPIRNLGKLTSFGWKFYCQNAGIFIGTLGVVPTEYAVRFAENVYRELFRGESRLTIGQAIARAKKRIAEDNRNLFWLLYCLYGDPDLFFEEVNPSEKSVLAE